MKVINKTIDMVASFGNKIDDVKPVRFRLETEEGEEIVIKIKNIMHKGNEKLAGKEYLIFTCTVELNSIERLCEIRFCKADCQWILFKI